MPARPWNSQATAFVAAALALILAAAWYGYRPGLTGTFLFDDFSNLATLGNQGPIDSWPAFWRYITSGFADPLGRPLALLTFLLDAQNWPADPAPFKRTNIFLHLLNGALLCGLLFKLGRIASQPVRRAAWAAILGAAFWLLHPLWVSTVLYVVQREAMLPATFILSGLLGYLQGRERIAQKPLLGAAIITASIGAGTLLAVLCKANGALLPLLALVVEMAFLRNVTGEPKPSPALNRCLRLVVWPPALFVCAYVAYAGIAASVHGQSAFRPWSVAQRLLTEPRILIDYLYLLAIPRIYSTGLFNDAYPASTDLFHPWTTLPAIAIVTGLIVMAWLLRKRHPYLALAVLFFFAGHLIESTAIPLELYFEHRNYVPAMLLFWPLALWLGDGGTWRLPKIAIALAVLLLLTVQTHYGAALWGKPEELSMLWAIRNPDSPRTQGQMASYEISSGDYAAAEARLRRALKQHPDDILLAGNLLGVRCAEGRLDEADIAAIEFTLREGMILQPQTTYFDWLEKVIDAASRHGCADLDMATIQRRFIDALRGNAHAAGTLPNLPQDLDNLEGQIALAQGDAALALQKFDAGLAVKPRPDVALRQAALLGMHGFPQAGLAHLDRYQQLATAVPRGPIRDMRGVHEWVLERQGYWQNEIAHLRKTLEEDAAAQTPAAAPPAPASR